MKVVVDTNVIAYYLLGTRSFAQEVRLFWHHVDEVLAPAAWEAELANVLWMATRTGSITPEQGQRRLAFAAAMGIHSVSNRTLWRGTLARAVSSRVAVYDTLFVELAARAPAPLATFDAKILQTFPDIAARPWALVAKA
jgi:predicted nucleic acid-binding protein